MQASDELAVTNNQASITITAEDGTTISYTLSLNILPTKITAAEIPKKADTDVRDSYVLFTIEANKDLSDYHLAVKETNEAAPTAAEMTAGALKRNLSANPINVLIAQRLNAPIIAFAEQHFADKTHTTLGANMHGHFAGSSTGFVMDNDAAGTHAWVNLSVLQPNTMYKLYGMEDGKDTVIDMLSFHTDAAITDQSGHRQKMFCVMSTAPWKRILSKSPSMLMKSIFSPINSDCSPIIRSKCIVGISVALNTLLSSDHPYNSSASQPMTIQAV